MTAFQAFRSGGSSQPKTEKRTRSTRHRGFTLIEIMLVVAIIGVVLAMSYPAISDMVHRAPLAQGVRDVMEGCRKARALAILQGHPMDLQIYPQDGRLNVAPAPVDADTSVTVSPDHATAEPVRDAQSRNAGGFSAQISTEVRLELIDVNFAEYKDADVASVRFYPNGTSDEFTMIMSAGGEYRKITLEVVTGLASMENKIK